MGESVSTESRRTRIARAAHDILSAELTRSVSIAELARACKTSPTVLKEAFREEYGVPVFEWHRRRRMIAAAKLLVKTELPVGEIARGGIRQRLEVLAGLLRLPGHAAKRLARPLWSPRGRIGGPQKLAMARPSGLIPRQRYVTRPY